MRFFILPVFVFLSACQSTGPVLVLHKTGSTAYQRERAFDACYIEAFKKVPPNTAISSTPGYSSPSRTSCYDSGYGIQCSTTGGYYSAPEVYSYDRNAGLRGRQAADCMKRKGYGAIERPICKTAAEREAYKQSRQAPSDQIECVSDAEVERLYPD